MDRITEELKAYYSAAFSEHGPTPLGVDWGREEDVRLRYEKMLAVIGHCPGPLLGSRKAPYTLLDVGCGYGGLCLYAREKGIPLRYSGIDVAENMIEHGRRNVGEAEFILGDYLELKPEERYDFIVCNGILTQKLSASQKEMDRHAHRLIRKMFDDCGLGIAFNVMTTKVNYFSNNLYYRNPAELLAFCLSDLSDRIALDHTYLYDFTTYLYR